jgi:hypothetical protein
MVPLLAPIRRRLHQQGGDGLALYPHDFVVDLVTVRLANVSRILADPRPEAEMITRAELPTLLATALVIPDDVSALYNKYQLQQIADARLDHRHQGVVPPNASRKSELPRAGLAPRHTAPPPRPPSQHQRRRSPSPPPRSASAERHRSTGSDRDRPPSSAASAPAASRSNVCLTHLCYLLKVDSAKCTRDNCRFSHTVAGRSKAELIEACAFLTKNPLVRAAAIAALNGSM